MKKLFVHTTATALLLSQLGMANSVFADSIETANTADQIQKEEEPSLVKGDFLYFVKTTVEKIQLLLTTNKVKEAELLAEFAGERIHEAQVLIKEGKEDLAKETIKEAVSQMESAQQEVDVELPASTETTTETTTGTTTETTTGTTTEDKATDETTTEETTTETETEKEEPKKLTKEQKEIAKIQHHLNNNLLVLANVLDQVKNPKAKAAIAKNIEKSFNKIADKLEKVLKNSKNTEEAILKPVIEIKYPESTTETTITTPEVVTTITKVEDVDTDDVKTTDVDVEDAKEVVENDEVVVSSTKKVEKVNQGHKQNHIEKKALKAVKKEEKEAKKEEKREAKREVKREKSEKHNNGKHLGHENENKSKGHGNKHD